MIRMIAVYKVGQKVTDNRHSLVVLNTTDSIIFYSLTNSVMHHALWTLHLITFSFLDFYQVRLCYAVDLCITVYCSVLLCYYGECQHCYAPDHREGGNKHGFCPSACLSVCPFIANIANNSGTQRPSMPKFGRKVTYLRCNSHTSFKVKRSKVRVGGGRGHTA